MAQTRLKVLSYNIHKGFTLGNQNYILNQLRTAIRFVRADLVFLQEVLGKHERHKREIKGWPDHSQFEFLADKIWPHFAYGKNAVYSTGHHGNAILSRFPFSSWENIDISTTRYVKRGLLHGVIDIPGFSKPLHAICLHMDLLKRQRAIQAGLLANRINKNVPTHCPLIIGGDFNDWGQSLAEDLELKLRLKEAFKEKKGAYAKTFPSKLPALPMDRIYFKRMNVLSAKCLSEPRWKKLSDHLAIYAEFSI